MTRTDLALTGAVAAMFRSKAAELRALAETLTPADHTRAIAIAIRVARLASRVQLVAEQVAGFNVMAPAHAGRTPDGPGDAPQPAGFPAVERCPVCQARYPHREGT